MFDFISANTGFLNLRTDFFFELVLSRENLVATINRVDVVGANKKIIISGFCCFSVTLGR